MKLKSILSLFVLIVLLGVSLFVSGVFADTGELDEVTKAIRQKNSQWSAQQTSISKLTPEERKKRLGSKYPIFSFTERILTRTSPSLPTRLDWRNYNGNSYVTPVKEQGDCGACWAFAVSAALESKILIAQNTPNEPFDLSEQVLTSCSNAGNCDGGYINLASDFISNYGLPPEYCFPYTSTNGACADNCLDWPSIAYTVSGWSLVDPNVGAIKDALYHYGPLVTLMAVNSDFFYYGSGIYSHAWGSFEGYHAALIVGYDDVNQSFIVKSSWGTDWGEAGYFRIAYSEIGSETIFGCWLIAYNSDIPSDFSIIDGILRNANGIAAKGTVDSSATENIADSKFRESGDQHNSNGMVDTKVNYELITEPAKTDAGALLNLPSASTGQRRTVFHETQDSPWVIAFMCETRQSWCEEEGCPIYYHEMNTIRCDGTYWMDWVYHPGSCESLGMPSRVWVDKRTEDQRETCWCPRDLPECMDTRFMGLGFGDSGPGPDGNSKTPNICSESAVNIKSSNLHFAQDAAGLILTYNSIDPYNGPLGMKWSYNYNLRLTPLSDNAAVKLKSSDGNIVYFRLSNGVYYPESISGYTSRIVKNQDGSYTQTAKNGLVYQFNSAGRLTSIFDRNGNMTTLTYNGNDLAGITNPSGGTTTITTANGLITSLTDPGGRTYSLNYSNGLLVSLTDPLGNAWQYTYDGTGRMLTKRDPAGYTVTYSYDTQGRLLTATDPYNRTRTMNYIQTGKTVVTEKDGGLWTYQYDPTFFVKTQKTDPLGNITRYAYDPKRNLISVTAPDNSITSYAYDSNSNLISAVYPLGRTTSYVYNSMNLVTSSTDPKGGVTAYGYDANGNLTSVTAPSGAVTAFEYDTRGNVTAMTDPNNRTMAFAYDAQNNLTSITDPLGNAIGFTYNAVGNRLTMTDPLGHTTSYVYNALNQMTQMTDPKGTVTHFTYDYEGNILSTTDANGRPTQYEYNYRGQLTRITDALNKLTQLSYGPSGCGSGCGGADKLSALTDALNHITRYNYDLAGRLTKETDPHAREINFTYDARGNLRTRIKPDGRTITYTYDAANRLAQKQYPGGSVAQYQYDANGNMTYAGNAAIAYNFTYDANNRLTGVTDSNNRTIQYQYDLAGNRTAIITPENRTIAYGHDNARRLTSITADSLTFTFGYDANSRRTSLAMPNGTGAGYTYDNKRQPHAN